MTYVTWLWGETWPHHITWILRNPLLWRSGWTHNADTYQRVREYNHVPCVPRSESWERREGGKTLNPRNLHRRREGKGRGEPHLSATSCFPPPGQDGKDGHINSRMCQQNKVKDYYDFNFRLTGWWKVVRILSRKDFELTLFPVSLRVSECVCFKVGSLFVPRCCYPWRYWRDWLQWSGLLFSPKDGLGYYLHGLSRPSVCTSTRCMCLSPFVSFERFCRRPVFANPGPCRMKAVVYAERRRQMCKV